LKLPPAERVALAEELLLSVAESDRGAVEAAWLSEVRRRDGQFLRGEVGAKNAGDVIARLTGDQRRL
jgi:hypothetical protein